MPSLPQVVIVGAGLVGSLLASLLARRGYNLVAFEKRPDLRRAAIPAGRSINLALAERGIRALEMADIMPEVEPLLIPMRGRLLHAVDGETEFQPYGSRPAEVIYSVSRTELNRKLLEHAEASGGQLRFEQECVEVDLDRGQLTTRDASRGTTEVTRFDLVLGADGVASVLRDAIVAKMQSPAQLERLDHDYKELSIPARPDGSHAIEREALHIWPRGGYMLIALPNLDGTFTVTLFLPREGEPSFAGLADEQAVRQFFKTQFPDAAALMPDLAREFFANPTGPLGTLRCPTWSDGKHALILGDAAHAIVPFHGQGMNAGFEDCAVLIDLLEAHDDDWEEVIPRFTAQRIPDAGAIANMALENYIVMRDRVQDPRFQQKKQLEFELEQRFPDRFIPRYSMVMFHHMPYAEVLARGRDQDRLLDQLLDERMASGAIDFELAEALLDSLL